MVCGVYGVWCVLSVVLCVWCVVGHTPSVVCCHRVRVVTEFDFFIYLGKDDEVRCV